MILFSTKRPEPSRILNPAVQVKIVGDDVKRRTSVKSNVLPMIAAQAVVGERPPNGDGGGKGTGRSDDMAMTLERLSNQPC